MGLARGIAGSTRPEVEGSFLCSPMEVDWFVRMNNTGGPVDVWAVDGVNLEHMVESPNGYWYLPAAIPAERLTFLHQAIRPYPGDETGGAPSSAYRSSITLDGTVDEEAHAWVHRNAPNEQARQSRS